MPLIQNPLNFNCLSATGLKTAFERAWLAWATNSVECDASSRHTLHQLATAAFKSWLLTGESAFLLDWRKGNGAQTRTKVKLIDSRQIDQSITRVTDGGSILSGVQFDDQGRVVGYWIRPFVLGNFNAAPQPVFVKARTSWGRPKAMLLFDLIAPGQIRGLSPLTPALSPAHAKTTLREFAFPSGASVPASRVTSTSACGRHATRQSGSGRHWTALPSSLRSR
jgi:capsid protein